MNSRLSRLFAERSFRMAIFIGLILCYSRAIANDQDQLPQIWQKRLPEETKRFSDFLKSRKTKSYTLTTSTKIPENGKLRSINRRQVVKRSGALWLYSKEEDADNPMDPIKNTVKQCYGLNSKYAFMLKGSKKSRDWVIHNITDVTEDLDEKTLFNMGVKTAQGDEGLRAVVNALMDSFDRGTLAVLLLSGTGAGNKSENIRVVEPWRIAELPGFRLRSLAAEGPRHNILHVEFDDQAVKDGQTKGDEINCQMYFDIEAQCHPIKSHQVLKVGVEEAILDWSRDLTQRKENEYELETNIQLKKKSNSAVTLLEERKVQTLFSLNDPPESEFTLSAFGLPEPPGIEWKKPFPWYFVFAGIGTVCLGVFFFLRSRGKRIKL